MARKVRTISKAIKNILVPVDFSVSSEKALSFATQIAAAQSSGKIFVMHSYRLIQPVPELADFRGAYDLKERLEKASTEKFRIIEEKYLKPAGVEYSFLLEIGFPENVIKTMSEKLEIDLIIMGTQGVSGIADILGSTTSHVIDTVDCPVLVIPRNATFKGINQITIAYDYKKLKYPEQLEIVLNLCRIFKAELHIVNFNTTKKTNNKDVLSDLPLDPFLDGVKHKYYFKATANIEEGINDFVKQEKTDVLVMIPHSHGMIESLFHSSITRKLVLHTDVPLLAIPD